MKPPSSRPEQGLTGSGDLVHGSFVLALYMSASHRALSARIAALLDRFLRLVTPWQTMWYFDDEGQAVPFDADRRALVRRQLLASPNARIHLTDRPQGAGSIRFEYDGLDLEVLRSLGMDAATSSLRIWLPPRWCDLRGWEAVRRLVKSISVLAPGWGSAGMGFSYLEGAWPEAVGPALRRAAETNPTWDIPSSPSALGIRDHVGGVSWLNLLGPSIVERLGGTPALERRLTVPGFALSPLSSGGLLVEVGSAPCVEPEAAAWSRYSLLACLLAPVTYRRSKPVTGWTLEATRDWEDRFARDGRVLAKPERPTA